MDEDCTLCDGKGIVVEDYVPEQETPFPDTEDGRRARELCGLEDLTKWEIAFCNSIADRVLEGRELSFKQRTVVDNILRRGGREI